MITITIILVTGILSGVVFTILAWAGVDPFYIVLFMFMFVITTATVVDYFLGGSDE